ncbi:MAG TPA: CHRD domain-containing protein [Phycisphaerales bacterium]|nr:CHRD domain-containing protein [Phycisphaerales bacterium]
MKKSVLFPAIIALSAGSASAHIVDFYFGMRGAAVVPPTESAARGSGLLSYNHHTFNYSLDLFVTGVSIDDLLGTGPNGTPLHLYQAPRGQNGDIMADPGFFGSFVEDGAGIRITLTDIRLGGQQGAFSSSIFETEQALYDGNLYIQLYTVQYPNGEIRGQLPRLGKGELALLDSDDFQGVDRDPIPAPSPGAGAIVPLAASLLLRRRR